MYIAYSESNHDFHCTLDELSTTIHAIGGNLVIVTGDFNSKSTLWGSPRTDWRGSAMKRWAAGLDLRLVNNGATPTCVHDQGSSVDLTWSSADVYPLVSN